jgi:uncharacterized membrane protein
MTMALADLWTWIETRPLAMYIGESTWFPFFESIHVLSATFVVGTLLVADLRLLGWSAEHHPVTVITREIVPWTWGAFVVAALTGAALFSVRASAYVANPAFLAKVVLLLLAGVNMLALHSIALRDIQWRRMQQFAGACSLLVWAGVVLAGRWIGHLS